MHTDQLNVSLFEARDMVYKQFPQYAGESIESMAANSGTVNSIFRVGAGATARFPLQQQGSIDICEQCRESEAIAMTEFADNCPYPSPRPIGIGQPTPAYPLTWSIQTWVEGEPNTAAGTANSVDFAWDIANLIKCLRTIDVQNRPFDGQGRGGRLPDHNAWMETCFTNSETLLDVPRLQMLWYHFRDLPRYEGPCVMSHRDLTPMNLLVRGVNLVGVLDTGQFGPADPALDLVAVWHMLDKDRRQLVRSLLRVEELEWLRGAGWAFEQAMGLVWYYEQSNPAMAALGKSTLLRILEDEGLSSSLSSRVYVQ